MSDYYNIIGNNGERRVFTIPISGLSKEEAENQLKELIADYKEEIYFDDSTGSIGSQGFILPISSNNMCQSCDVSESYDLKTKKEIIRNGIYTNPPEKIDMEIKKPWYKKLFRL